MHSIRTKTILLSVFGITVAIGVSTAIGAISIANLGHQSSEQTLGLLCETGKNNLNYYFKSVEQSVNTISSLIDTDLDALSDSDFVFDFSNHVEGSRGAFLEAANNTNGVYTFYYRIDPSITDLTGEKGYWYTNLDGKGFKEHEVTDLSDKNNECRWFYMTKDANKPIWLTPYVTDNLDDYVLSYNAPVYRNDVFVGVAGIEINYVTLGEQIKDIKIHKTGYAFVVDSASGQIIFHPTLDVLGTDEKDRPAAPQDFIEQLKAGQHHIEYNYDGVHKHAYALPLSNGMHIVVAVPISEVNETWLNLVIELTAIGLGLVAITIIISIIFSNKITKPLRQLTEAAEKINDGDYTFKLEYKGDNEIGLLTSAVNKLVLNLGEYVHDLNNLAYADALTSVKNKSAFDSDLAEIQKRIEDPNDHPEFAIAILDCDNLKDINDAYGHDKGDIYLRNSCHLMVRVFEHSTVYRIGGDEFAIILEDEDYSHRKALEKSFIEKTKEICAFAEEPWEKLSISIGIAAYDPKIDNSTQDVVIHADHLMYTDKRAKKAGKK